VLFLQTTSFCLPPTTSGPETKRLKTESTLLIGETDSFPEPPPALSACPPIAVFDQVAQDTAPDSVLSSERVDAPTKHFREMSLSFR
jgi:hypothetical protein